MKPTTLTPLRNVSTVLAATTEPEPAPVRDLQWVDEVAALLPEESRLGWYQNVRPWLRMLPPDDEVAHLAYSMGYLALLTRSTPALVAAERVKLAALLQRLTEEAAASLKTTAEYHKKLHDRLSSLPAEISRGLSPTALAAEIVERVREQFLNCGVPEAGRLLKEQEDSLRRLLADQIHVLADSRQQLKDSRSRVNDALDSVVGSAKAARNSIDLWNREMQQVQRIYLALMLLVGALLGALFYRWVVTPPEAGPPQMSNTQQSQPADAVSGRRTRHEPK